MDTLLRQPLDDLQTEFPQLDAQARQLGMLLDDADHVALGGIGVHAEQQIGRREIEETERMRLHELRAVQQLPQLNGSRRNPHCQNAVAGFGGCQQVAHRANTAYPRGDAGHFVEGAPLGKLFESTRLGDVELRAGNTALIIQMD